MKITLITTRDLVSFYIPSQDHYCLFPSPPHILMPCSCTRAYEQIDQEFVYVRSAIWRLCNQKKGDKKNCIKMIFNTSTIYESTNANGSNYMHHRKDIQRNTNSLFLLQNWIERIPRVWCVGPKCHQVHLARTTQVWQMLL